MATYWGGISGRKFPQKKLCYWVEKAFPVYKLGGPHFQRNRLDNTQMDRNHEDPHFPNNLASKTPFWAVFKRRNVNFDRERFQILHHIAFEKFPFS